jgi:hypothetical protein
MKKTLLILLALFAGHAGVLGSSEFKRHIELEAQIQGEWLAAEYYLAQPPADLQQAIKSMSFRTNNIVEWEYVHDGQAHKATGRYGLYSFPANKKVSRQLPKLIVAPTNYSEAIVSSHVLLTLTDVEMDFDSRFHVDHFGKLLKAKDPQGKRLLFIRKEKKVSRGISVEKNRGRP